MRAGDRLTLGGDVDLLAPVDVPVGEFPADGVVPAKVRTLDHRNSSLALVRQSKESSCDSTNVVDQIHGDTVTGQVEKPDFVRYFAQFHESGRRIQLTHINDGQHGRTVLQRRRAGQVQMRGV